MKKKRITSILGAVALTAAMTLSCMPVMAENYAPIAGTTTTFDKYLEMDQDANVPNASFTFTVAAGMAEGDVLAGVDAGKVTMTDQDTTTDGYQLVFTPDDTATNKEGDNSKKIATKAVTVDFSQCSFTEPGVYRYVITESGTNQAVTNDEASTRNLDVYVIDKEGALEIGGYFLNAGSEKSEGFTNTYDTSNLTISKTVTGNQGSRDKYFKFTVEIKNAVAGTKYDVDLTNAEVNPVKNAGTSYTSMTNPTTITAESGTVTTDFYLKHGQSIVIKGLAKETTFKVTEAEENYTPSVEVDGVKTENYNTTDKKMVASTNITAAYTNDRSGTIPTGVLMTVTPFAVLTLLGGFGAAKIVMKKRREDGEE